MPVRSNRADEAGRRARRQIDEIIRDLRIARLSAGVPLSAVAKSIGCSRQFAGMIEAGQIQYAGLVQLARFGAVVGLDVSFRTFLAGSPLRDAGHLRLLDRFRASVGDRWQWRTEVPVSDDPLDRRAFDGMLLRPQNRIGVEAIVRLVDAQAQVRAATLKQEASRVECVLLVLADTRHNRSMLRLAAPTIRPAFPLGTRETLRSIRAGVLPSANGVVLI